MVCGNELSKIPEYQHEELHNCWVLIRYHLFPFYSHYIQRISEEGELIVVLEILIEITAMNTR